MAYFSFATTSKRQVPRNSPINGLDGDSKADETLKLIYDAYDELSVQSESQRNVLMIGDTGAGKSTITNFITAMPLTSIKDGCRYLITDEKNKINANLISHTYYPEKYVDLNSGYTYYDQPGFNDTRSEPIQLANSWATKRVADHSENMKIVIIANYSSLRSGESRNDFKKLMELVTTLILDPAKFKNSIALIASKVDHYVPDDEVMPTIVDFLEKARKDVKTLFGDDRDVKKIKAIIDALLTQKRGAYTRIEYFKQPNEAGRFDLQPYFRERRNALRKMIETAMDFTKTSPDDFGISVSPEAKLYVRVLLDKLQGSLKDKLKIISKAVEQHFQQSISNPIGSVSIGKIMDDSNNVESMIRKLKTCNTRKEFFQALSKGVGNFPGIQSILPDLVKLNEIIDFYAQVDQRSIPPQTAEWVAPLKDTLDFIQQKTNILAEKLNAKTEKNLLQIISSVQSTFVSKLAPGVKKNHTEEKALLKKATDIMKYLEEVNSSLPSKSSFNAFAESINIFVRRFSANFTPKQALLELEMLPDDAPFDRLPQLKADSWRRHFTEMVQVTSSHLSQCTLRLQRVESEGKVKSLNENITEVKDELQKSKERAAKLGSELQKMEKVASRSDQEIEQKIAEALRKKKEEEEAQAREFRSNVFSCIGAAVQFGAIVYDLKTRNKK